MVGGPGRREVAAVDVEAGVLLLPLGPAVLEPDLHLNKYNRIRYMYVCRLKIYMLMLFNRMVPHLQICWILITFFVIVF